MADAMRVILEVGKKRRVVAGAMDWPGLDRWGAGEEAAIERLSTYRPRYAGVAERAGLAREYARTGEVEVVERVPGSSSTDFWGIAHVPSLIEDEVLPSAELERRLTLLQRDLGATSTTSSRRVTRRAAAVGSDVRPHAEQIARHVYINEPEQMSRKVEVRTDRDVVMTPDGLAAHREAYLDAIRAWNAEGKRARTWPIQFLIRRTAHHVMDHAWELEDRDPAAAPES